VTSAETIAERSPLGGATDRHDAVSRRLRRR
jgi:hypothetical protein